MRRITLFIFALVTLATLFVVLCTFVRRPYETILIDRFGSILVYNDENDKSVHPPIMYHWYLKSPFDRKIPIDNRIHLYSSPLQQVVTAGSEPISIRTYAAWRIVDPKKFNLTTSSDDGRAEAILAQKISGLVQARVAAHRLEELFNVDETKVHMADMEKQIALDATNGTEDPTIPGGKMTGVSEQGLEIVQIGFSRMAFPPSNSLAVYDRMAAERNKQSTDFASKGRAIQQQLEGEGAAEAKQIRGEAEKKAQEIMGQADREANSILASVQQTAESRDFYQYWKSLEFVTSSFTKNTYIVISTDTDWLRAAFTAPANGAMPAATQPVRNPAAIPPAQLTVPPSSPAINH